MSLSQSNLRKQIRNLPKILNFVTIIQNYSLHSLAGTAIPTIRDMAAFVAEQRKAILVRINPEEPVVRSGVFPSIGVALGARDALSQIDAEIRRAG